jgi:hypothetical protein
MGTAVAPEVSPPPDSPDFPGSLPHPNATKISVQRHALIDHLKHLAACAVTPPWCAQVAV